MKRVSFIIQKNRYYQFWFWLYITVRKILYVSKLSGYLKNYTETKYMTFMLENKLTSISNKYICIAYMYRKRLRALIKMILALN